MDFDVSRQVAKPGVIQGDSRLNEGLGGCYERWAFSRILIEHAKAIRAKRVLELNATYIAGIPGMNSCILAQEGFDVTLTVRPRDYKDILHVWDIMGLPARIIELHTDTRTPFETGEFDLVWNHLAFEQYRDPMPLVVEMY